MTSLSSPCRSLQCLSVPHTAMLRMTFRNLIGQAEYWCKIKVPIVFFILCTHIGCDIFCPFVACRTSARVIVSLVSNSLSACHPHMWAPTQYTTRGWHNNSLSKDAPPPEAGRKCRQSGYSCTSCKSCRRGPKSQVSTSYITCIAVRHDSPATRVVVLLGLKDGPGVGTKANETKRWCATCA